MEVQKPSLCRAVLYCTQSDTEAQDPVAAIVTETYSATVEIGLKGDGDGMMAGLVVFTPIDTFHMRGVPFSPELKSGHWSWPKRV